MPNINNLNEFQIRSLLTKNYMSEFNLIEDYSITFNSDGSKANIEIDFKEGNK
tara:strand:+ start:926 stop:1084 length:159 start_codon:yes stop_codon:yes gene_type:complete